MYEARVSEPDAILGKTRALWERRARRPRGRPTNSTDVRKDYGKITGFSGFSAQSQSGRMDEQGHNAQQSLHAYLRRTARHSQRGSSVCQQAARIGRASDNHMVGFAGTPWTMAVRHGCTREARAGANHRRPNGNIALSYTRHRPPGNFMQL